MMLVITSTVSVWKSFFCVVVAKEQNLTQLVDHNFNHFHFWKMFRQITLFVLALVAGVAVGKFNPDTVKELDVAKYLGLWYQMAADQIVYSTFEKDAYCATAFYGANGDGTISVHNYATIGAPNGTTYVIDGYAYQTDAAAHPGQLKVKFDSDQAAPFPAPYWVLELGPINANNQYDWAIVSDNLSSFLFVLARDVPTFNSQYKASIMAELTKLGFTGRTAPIDTYHQADCVYESTQRLAQIKKFESAN